MISSSVLLHIVSQQVWQEICRMGKEFSVMEDSYSSDKGNNGSRILRGHWRPEEDEKLRQFVLTYGAKNWNSIAESIEGRTGKSCRLRWFNQLNPMINKGPFSKEEEERLIEAHKIHGNKWSTIASLFPGRTDNALKNHFHVVRARKRREEMRSPGPVRTPPYSDARFQNPLMNRSHFRGYGTPYPFQYSAGSSSSWNEECLRRVRAPSNSISFGFYGLRIGADAWTENDNFGLKRPKRFSNGISSWMATGSSSVTAAPYNYKSTRDQRTRQTTPLMNGNWSLLIDSNSGNGISGEGSCSVDKDAPAFIDFLGVGDHY